MQREGQLALSDIPVDAREPKGAILQDEIKQKDNGEPFALSLSNPRVHLHTVKSRSKCSFPLSSLQNQLLPCMSSALARGGM